MRGSSKVGDQIGWALDARRAAIENVGVDLRRADVTVSQKLLDGPDVVPRLEQVRREGVPRRLQWRARMVARTWSSRRGRDGNIVSRTRRPAGAVAG